jgi:hypothetical protein
VQASDDTPAGVVRGARQPPAPVVVSAVRPDREVEPDELSVRLPLDVERDRGSAQSVEPSCAEHDHPEHRDPTKLVHPSLLG